MALSGMNFGLLAESMVLNQSVNVWDKGSALELLIDTNVCSEQDYKDLLGSKPSGKPVVEPPTFTYTPKPLGDDTPQWIWDHYKNCGRTS